MEPPEPNIFLGIVEEIDNIMYWEILFELLHTRPQSKFIGNKKWTIDMCPIPAGVCPCGAATRAEAYAEGQQTTR